MKSLVIVEGRNEQIFLEKLISDASVRKDLRPHYYNNMGSTSQKKNQETQEIRKFLGARSPYNLLIKVEGGRSFVISLFREVSANFILQGEGVGLLAIFDHDNRAPESDISSISNDLKARTGGKISFRKINEETIVDGFTRRDFELCKLSSGSWKPTGKFSFATFNSSLENLIKTLYSKGRIDHNDIHRFTNWSFLKS